MNRHPDQIKGSLSPDQHRLYEQIWKRFVACQMPPAVWQLTEVDVSADTPSGQGVFKAIGRTLEFDGYLRVAGVPKSGEQILPEFAESQPLAAAPVTRKNWRLRCWV